MTVQEFNSLSTEKAVEQLLLCCGSTKWAGKMSTNRPFPDAETMLSEANRIWKEETDREDWLEAFTHHPKIGDIDSLRSKFATTKTWAEGEQKGAASASEEVLQKLAAGNQAYENRYGYIFIVCATGKSAREMLEILESRMDNDPEKEIRIAAEEQQKITEIRINKLLS